MKSLHRLSMFPAMLAFAFVAMSAWTAACAFDANLTGIQPAASSGPTPSPLAVGGQTKWNLTINAGSPAPHDESQPGAPAYNWSYSAQTSADGTNYGAAPSDGSDIHFDSTASASPTLFATLKTAAYWKITVSCTVSYTDKKGSSFTWGGSGSCNAAVAVVGVAKLQYQQVGSTWVDLSSTVYAVTGTTLQIKAIPSPTGASWPAGKPTWTGASGSGPAATSNLNSHSADLGSPTDIIATCGTSQATASVLVCDLDPTRTPSDNFTGRSSTRYGIAESLSLGFVTVPAGVTAAQLGGLQWTQIIPASGSGTLISSGGDGSGSYVCPGDAGIGGSSVTLQLAVLSGISKGKSANSTFIVVAPIDIHYVIDSSIFHYQYHGSCGYLAAMYVTPNDVSFTACEISEDTCPSGLTGWYSQKYPSGYPDHDPTGGTGVLPMPPVSGGSMGNRVGDINTHDNIWGGIQDPPPTYAAGTFIWQIPERYRIGDNGTWHQLFKAQQQFQVDSTGAMTASKHDSGPVTKAWNADTVPHP